MLLFVLACADSPTLPAIPSTPSEPPPIAEVAKEPGAPSTTPTGIAEASPTPSRGPSRSARATIGQFPIETSTDGAWTSRRAGDPSSGDAALGGLIGGGSVTGGEGLGMRGSGLGGGGYGSGGAGLGGGGRIGAAPSPAVPGAPPPTEVAAASPAGRPDPAVERARQAPASPLRAGSTDDNADFDAYMAFLARWPEDKAVAGAYQYLPVHDRYTVTVTDRTGRPVPGAAVDVRFTDGSALALTTYGDGRTALYPTLGHRQRGVAGCPCTVTVRTASGEASSTWDGRSDLDLQLGATWEAPAAVPLDVVFLIDTTGSMADEIAQVQATLLSVTDRVRGIEGEVDLRYGAVLYRDLGDTYLTRLHPLTGDTKAFDAALREVVAGGGGDTPESLNQGLLVAVEDIAWRPSAAKLVFLIADAPPHLDYQDDVPYGDSAWSALERGVRVHTVAASGLDDAGSLVFRQIAQLTRGQFIFIEYGSVAASAADHGVTGQVDANNLDRILFDRIRAEVTGFAVVAGR